MQAIGEWTSARAKLWGIVLTVGILLPIIASFGEMTVISWPWDFIGASPFMILPLLLGIGAILIAAFMTGIMQGVTLFLCSVGVVAISFFMDVAAQFSVTGTVSFGSPILSILAFSSLIAIATGNHLRKSHPGEALPRFLAGVGGCVLVALFVIPFEGSAPIAGLFDSMAWKMAWGMMLIILAVFGYGVIGAITLLPIPNVALICSILSILARGVLVALPLLLLTAGGGEGFGMLLFLVLKTCAMMYGMLILPAVGLTSWISHTLRESR
ncbi:MAG: hypothetical protein A2Z34_07170 [Planctomycetes bacterium RBG_16_59_8]|nr:MAG: hypothetical protein A2Z34_07170 [Planctomycetes bacterium RBG_16_59_8]